MRSFKDWTIFEKSAAGIVASGLLLILLAVTLLLVNQSDREYSKLAYAGYTDHHSSHGQLAKTLQAKFKGLAFASGLGEENDDIHCFISRQSPAR